MKRRKLGKRYPLLLYRRVMDRLWAATLALGLILLAAWSWAWFRMTPLFLTQDSIWLVVGAAVLLGFTLFALIGRRVAYVQARKDHICLVTPFLRTNFSYRRIRRIYPTAFQLLFPPDEASWAQRQLLSPFYGKTAVVIELNGYPLPPLLLRFFLAPQMFSPKTSGLVLLVPDWMVFSTEIDSYRGVWLQSQGRRRRTSTGMLNYGLDA